MSAADDETGDDLLQELKAAAPGTKYDLLEAFVAKGYSDFPLDYLGSSPEVKAEILRNLFYITDNRVYEDDGKPIPDATIFTPLQIFLRGKQDLLGWVVTPCRLHGQYLGKRPDGEPPKYVPLIEYFELILATQQYLWNGVRVLLKEVPAAETERAEKIIELSMKSRTLAMQYADEELSELQQQCSLVENEKEQERLFTETYIRNYLNHYELYFQRLVYHLGILRILPLKEKKKKKTATIRKALEEFDSKTPEFYDYDREEIGRHVQPLLLARPACITSHVHIAKPTTKDAKEVIEQWSHYIDLCNFLNEMTSYLEAHPEKAEMYEKGYQLPQLVFEPKVKQVPQAEKKQPRVPPQDA
jgi:hypothetical protein